MIQAYQSHQIFTGTEWLTDHAVLVEGDSILDVVHNASIPPGINVTSYNEGFIAPAFIDLQIYGANGFLLSVNPTAEAVQNIYEYCKNGGAHFFQPTVATNSYEVIYNCIDAVRDYFKSNGKGAIGLHIEGPWINKEKRGAHIEKFIHSPTLQQAKDVLDYGKGIISMITLAPEVCSAEVIQLVQSYGVIVSAGHSNATYQQGLNAFNAGIPAATHLFNAMSPLLHRAPGMPGAVMHHKQVMSSIVNDGYHVDFAAVSIAKKAMDDRLFFITDAVTETNEGYYPHQLEGDKYVSNGILSGSALTMAKSVKNGVEKADISLTEALKMASLYPAKVMKMDHLLGKIAKGYKAEMVVLNDEYNILNSITSA